MKNRIFWERYVSSIEKAVDEHDDESGMKITPVAASPHGLIPITENLLFTKHLDLWTAHTNFDVTEDIVFNLDKIPGVEVLMPVTRYSFRVGFKTKARLFNIQDVKDDIEILCNAKKDELAPFTLEQRRLIRDEKNIASNSPYWILFVFPNGKIYSVASETNSQEFVKKVKLLKEAKQRLGGVLMESDYVHSRRIQNGAARREDSL